MIEATQLEYAEQKGERNLLMRLLNRQLGAVSPNIASRLESLTIDQLNALGDAIFDLHSYADLDAWLSRQ